MLSSLVTSHCSIWQFPDFDWTNSGSFVAVDGFRTPAITCFPPSKSCFTNSRPIPRDAPTITHVSGIGSAEAVDEVIAAIREWQTVAVSQIELLGSDR